MTQGPDSWLERIFNPDEPQRNPSPGDGPAADDNHAAAQALAYTLAALVEDSRPVFATLELLSVLAAQAQATEPRYGAVRRGIDLATAHYEHAAHAARDTPPPPTDAPQPPKP